MPSLDMGQNSYELTKESIEKLIPNGRIGNYALGYLSNNGSFVVQYVGRSDIDLKDRLVQHLSDEKPHKRFKFSIAKDVKEAYEKECKNYHDFGGEDYLENTIHPRKPDGTNFKCTYCGK